MPPTRRQFIAQFGVTLASLIAARCTPAATPTATPTPTTLPVLSITPPIPTPIGTTATPTATLTAILPTPTATPTPTAIPPGGGAVPLRDQLRGYWLQLGWIEQQAQETYGQVAERDTLIAEHRATLDRLAATGELDAEVADQVQIAFAAAIYDAWLAGYRRFSICYTATPSPLPDYTPEPYETIGHTLSNYTFSSAYRLREQANLLAEMIESGNLDPEAAAQAQAAIEREITFMATFYTATRAGLERVIAPSHLSNEETWALHQELEKIANNVSLSPHYRELDLEITPKAAKAARFLVELLAEE